MARITFMQYASHVVREQPDHPRVFDWWQLRHLLFYKMNTYGIVLSSGATHYGGITRCSVSQRRLILAFSEDAEAALGFSGADITLELSDAEVAALRQGLIHVFALSKAVPHVLEL